MHWAARRVEKAQRATSTRARVKAKRQVKFVSYSSDFSEDLKCLTIVAPLRIVSTANLREHWRTKSSRHIQEKLDTALALRATAHSGLRALGILGRVGCVITLTRLGPRLLDSDNLAGGFKAHRDAIANWLGIDDGDPRLEWRYEQKKSAEYGCIIDIRRKER